MKSLLVVAAVLALYACKDSPVVGPSDRTFSLSAVTPVDLSSTVGAQVVPSPTVRVTDSNGAPLAGTPISFKVTSGNGSLTSTLVQTDAAGSATVGWTLDTIAGANRMIVRAINLPPVVFTVRVTAGPVRRMTADAGNGQIAFGTSVLPSPLRAKILDAYANPVSGATVTFSVISGDGSIEEAAAISDAGGLATSGTWTLGRAPGEQKVSARSGTAEVVFTGYQGCSAASIETSCATDGQLIFTRLSDRQIYRMSIDGTGLTRLTSSGTHHRAALSRDGRRIAFSKGSFSTPDIYLMDADGSNVVRRTFASGFAVAAWSPDGRKLAVSPEGIYTSSIYLISTEDDGASPILLAAEARSPAWSPDGKQIAFIHVSGDDGYDQVFVMNADGTNPRALTEAIGGLYRPSWSPDGKRIAFTRHAGGGEAYVVNADGTGLRPITNIGTVNQAIWSLDGKWLVVSLWPFGGIPAIGYVPADGGVLRVVVTDAFHPEWLP